MSKEIENNKSEALYDKGLWDALHIAVPEALVLHKKEKVALGLNVCVVFCPLYAYGDLSDSKLIFPPVGIDGSRVSGKFKAYLPAIISMHKYLEKMGGGVNLTAVFANKGVLLADNPTPGHVDALEYHKSLYKDAMAKFCGDLGIHLSFYDYDDFDIDFPKFYNPRYVPLPDGIQWNSSIKPESQMISALSQYFGFSQPIEDNKTNRKVVKNVLQLKDTTFEAAFWLIAGYLAFDPKIPKLVGEGGIYMVSERADSLFWISKLTPKLDSLTRVQIKVT